MPEMKEQLFEIKTEVKAKASEIVAEAKAKGKAALHKVSGFLRIKDKLESVRENVRKRIAETEHTINKLDAFGSGMREAGKFFMNYIFYDLINNEFIIELGFAVFHRSVLRLMKKNYRYIRVE